MPRIGSSWSSYLPGTSHVDHRRRSRADPRRHPSRPRHHQLARRAPARAVRPGPRPRRRRPRRPGRGQRHQRLERRDAGGHHRPDPARCSPRWSSAPIRSTLEWISRRMDRAAFGNSFAKGAIEMALLDLQGQILGVPVYKLLGGRRHGRRPRQRPGHSPQVRRRRRRAGAGGRACPAHGRARLEGDQGQGRPARASAASTSIGCRPCARPSGRTPGCRSMPTAATRSSRRSGSAPQLREAGRRPVRAADAARRPRRRWPRCGAAAASRSWPTRASSRRRTPWR